MLYRKKKYILMNTFIKLGCVLQVTTRSEVMHFKNATQKKNKVVRWTH